MIAKFSESFQSIGDHSGNSLFLVEYTHFFRGFFVLTPALDLKSLKEISNAISSFTIQFKTI